MRYTMSEELSSKIDKLVIEGVRDLNIYIPDGNIFSLTEYVKKKVKWTVIFNLRHTILEYINNHDLLYTEFGDNLYHLLNYVTDDSKTKSKHSTSMLTVQVDLVIPVDMSTLDICYIYHKIYLNGRNNEINPNELLNIENLLNMNGFNKLYELFTSNFDFILRKGIYDLGIEVNEDIEEDDLVKYDDF